MTEIVNSTNTKSDGSYGEQSSKTSYITRAQVAEHSSPTDMWIVIKNQVYDLTKFQKRHPGGKAVLNEVAGKDGTEAWREASHSPKANEQMKEFVIGEIDPNEKLEVELAIDAKPSDFVKIFPYISAAAFSAFLYFCLKHTDLHLDSGTDYLGFCFGIIPSICLILTGIKLWPGHVFRVHRVGGLCYLIQYAVSWYFFFTDYNWFKNSFLVWSLLLNGICQTISAIIEIGHTLNPHDKGEYFGNTPQTISRDFVIENLFYQLIVTYSSLYYYPQFFNAIRSNIFGQIIEIIFVFFPYQVLRPFFPKTSLRNAVKENSTVITEDNRLFTFMSTWAIRCILLFGKHYVGSFTNTLRYLGGLNKPEEEKLLQFMMLANAGSVTISMFLHTLKFKNKLSPRVALTIYLMFVYTPVIAMIQLVPSFFPYWKMFIIFTIGLFVNFTPKHIIHSWSVIVAALFIAYHNGMLPDAEKLIY